MSHTAIGGGKLSTLREDLEKMDTHRYRWREAVLMTGES